MLDVYPTAVGRGVHLCRDLTQPTGLRLIRSQPFPGDVVLNVDAPPGAPIGGRTATL